MRCVKCGHGWIDCPGESGKAYKHGCSKCGTIYWTSEPARKVGKLKQLIQANRTH